MHCRMFSGIPGLYTLDPLPGVVTTKMSPDTAECLLAGKNHPLLRTTALKEASLSSLCSALPTASDSNITQTLGSLCHPHRVLNL